MTSEGPHRAEPEDEENEASILDLQNALLSWSERVRKCAEGASTDSGGP